MASSLGPRIFVAVVAIPAAFGIVALGGWLLVAILGLLGIVGTIEFFRIARDVELAPINSVGYVGALLFPTAIYAMVSNDGELAPAWFAFAVLGWCLSVLIFAVWTRPPSRSLIGSVSVTIFAPVYTAALPSTLLLIRHGSPTLTAVAAAWLVFLPLVATWLCDTFAMTGGAMFGGPKLAPVISPNKTWSGAVSGLLGAVVAALLLGTLVLRRYGILMSPLELAAIGASAGTVGQIGDLAESLFKRSAGRKDSGTFFPGHGGVLDRLDSLYWNLPVTSMWLVAFGVL